MAGEKKYLFSSHERIIIIAVGFLLSLFWWWVTWPSK